MSDLSKSFTLEEVEALLAAERERCAKVAASFEVGPWWRETDIPPAIAAAIRSLAPQTMGGERPAAPRKPIRREEWLA